MNYAITNTDLLRLNEREAISLADILDLLRRNIKFILVTIFIFLALGLAALILLPKKYEASALVLIDPRQIDILANKASTDARLLTTDSLVVDSEVEILNSRELQKRVAERAGMYSDPEYTTPSALRRVIWPLYSLITSLFGDEAASAADSKAMILSAFARNITVERVGLTYVLQITYESDSPARAANVANLITEEYLADGLRVQSEASRKSSEWIKQRLSELQRDVIAADRAVEVYKMENDLVSTQTGGLVTEQQVAEISSRQVAAQADVAQTRARLDAARASLQSGNYATLSGGSSTDVLSKLLGERQVEQQDAAKFLAAYGPTHLSYRKIGERIAELDRQIREELQRIVSGYEADYRAAKQLDDSLRGKLAELKRTALEGGKREVKLRELEQQAVAAKSIYQSLLDEFSRAVQQQTLPTERARVIQTADPPPKWTKPNWKIVAALSLLLGVGCGVGGAFLRESLKSSVHTSREIEIITGRPNLGLLPALPALARKRRGRSILREPAGEPAAAPENGEIPAKALAGYHAVLRDEGGIVLDTLRSMEVAVRLAPDQRPREDAVVVAIGSALAGEGKSTVSALFSLHLAWSGARVLLIDYDFRRGGLTERFRPAHQLMSDRDLEPASESGNLMWDPLTGLIFFPAPGRREAGREISRVISGGTERRISRLRSSFDFIVLDLPPLFHLPQGRMLAHEIDKFIFVVEWGKPNIRTLERSLAHIPEITNLLAGSVMNKFNKNGFIGYDKSEFY
jgi:succinoglycan biosynthesis transport protein ExoP